MCLQLQKITKYESVQGTSASTEYIVINETYIYIYIYIYIYKTINYKYKHYCYMT